MDKKRKPRWKRRDTGTPPNLQPRDIDIVESVYKYRALSTRQIQLLHFSERNRSGTQRRLDVLFDHHYLDRRFLPVPMGTGSSPTLYILDQAGRNLLKNYRQLEVKWYPTTKQVTDLFLWHTYGISQVMTFATHSARLMPDLELVSWLSEREVKAEKDTVEVPQDGKQPLKLPIVPDSIFEVIRGNKFRFFLELDRAEEDLKRFAKKVVALIQYHQSGAYEERYGGRSLRILTVVDSRYGDSSVRLNNLKRVTEDAGGKSRFLFARLSDLSQDEFWTEPVWHVAGQSGQHPLFQ